MSMKAVFVKKQQISKLVRPEVNCMPVQASSIVASKHASQNQAADEPIGVVQESQFANLLPVPIHFANNVMQGRSNQNRDEESAFALCLR